MVFYFTLSSDPSVVCYMGHDKFENEELLRWGWPEDIWFHVDGMSSAHVYVRLPPGKGLCDLMPEMVEECCQLCKANSIQGCKSNDVTVVYTPWPNLKKTGDMDVGQVAFHDPKQCQYFTVEKKNSSILNALEKTRVEKTSVDFRALREQRDDEERHKLKRAEQAKRTEEAKKKVEQKQKEELMHFESLMDPKKMHSNRDVEPEEDFM